MEFSKEEIKGFVIALIESDLDRAMAGNLKSVLAIIDGLGKFQKKTPHRAKDFYKSYSLRDLMDHNPTCLTYQPFYVITCLLGLDDEKSSKLCKPYIKKVTEGAGTYGDPNGIEIAHAREAQKIYEFLNKH